VGAIDAERLLQEFPRRAALQTQRREKGTQPTLFTTIVAKEGLRWGNPTEVLSMEAIKDALPTEGICESAGLRWRAPLTAQRERERSVKDIGTSYPAPNFSRGRRDGPA